MGSIFKFAKHSARKILQKAGYKVVKNSEPGKQYGSNALNFIDGFLSGHLRNRGNLAILQCGANDGVTVDPVRAFIVRHSNEISAVLVEPLPDVHSRLQENYRASENITTLNVAIGPDREIPLYRIKKKYDAMYSGIIASGITSFDRDFVLRKARNIRGVDSVPVEERIECISVPCLTVSQVIDAYETLGIEPFLQVDTEGYDDQVIYSIDLGRHRPIAINYEISLLSNYNLQALQNYLAGNGYRCLRWNQSDEIAIRT